MAWSGESQGIPAPLPLQRKAGLYYNKNRIWKRKRVGIWELPGREEEPPCHVEKTQPGGPFWPFFWPPACISPGRSPIPTTTGTGACRGGGAAGDRGAQQPLWGHRSGAGHDPLAAHENAGDGRRYVPDPVAGGPPDHRRCGGASRMDRGRGCGPVFHAHGILAADLWLGVRLCQLCGGCGGDAGGAAAVAEDLFQKIRASAPAGRGAVCFVPGRSALCGKPDPGSDRSGSGHRSLRPGLTERAGCLPWRGWQAVCWARCSCSAIPCMASWPPAVPR